MPMSVSIGRRSGQKTSYVGIRGLHTGMDANPPFDHEKATVGPRTTATTLQRTCLLALIPSILFVNILLKGSMHFEGRKSAVYKAVYEVLRADVVKNVLVACSAHVLIFAMVYLPNTRICNKIGDDH